MLHEFTVEVRPAAGSLTLCLAGDLDLSTVGTLRACLEQIDDGVRTVVLDLSGLTFLDSSGLNLFALTHRRFGPEMRELLLANPRPAVRRVLQVSGLDELLPVTIEALDDPIASESA